MGEPFRSFQIMRGNPWTSPLCNTPPHSRWMCRHQRGGRGWEEEEEREDLPLELWPSAALFPQVAASYPRPYRQNYVFVPKQRLNSSNRDRILQTHLQKKPQQPPTRVLPILPPSWQGYDRESYLPDNESYHSIDDSRGYDRQRSRNNRSIPNNDNGHPCSCTASPYQALANYVPPRVIDLTRSRLGSPIVVHDSPQFSQRLAKPAPSHDLHRGNPPYHAARRYLQQQENADNAFPVHAYGPDYNSHHHDMYSQPMTQLDARPRISRIKVLEGNPRMGPPEAKRLSELQTFEKSGSSCSSLEPMGVSRETSPSTTVHHNIATIAHPDNKPGSTSTLPVVTVTSPNAPLASVSSVVADTAASTLSDSSERSINSGMDGTASPDVHRKEIPTVITPPSPIPHTFPSSPSLQSTSSRSRSVSSRSERVEVGTNDDKAETTAASTTARKMKGAKERVRRTTTEKMMATMQQPPVIVRLNSEELRQSMKAKSFEAFEDGGDEKVSEEICLKEEGEDVSIYSDSTCD